MRWDWIDWLALSIAVTISLLLAGGAYIIVRDVLRIVGVFMRL